MTRITYIRSLLTWYQKGIIEVDKNLITLKTPNVIMGIFAPEYSTETIPVASVESVRREPNIDKKELLYGFLGILLFFGILVGIIWSLFEYKLSAALVVFTFVVELVIFIVSGHWVIDAMELDLVITTFSRREIIIDFFYFEKDKAKQAEDAIKNAMAQQAHNRNGYYQAHNGSGYYQISW